MQEPNKQLTEDEKWKSLSKTDAVLEAGVVDVIGDLIRGGGDPSKVVAELKAGYSGLPHKIHLVLDCIALLDAPQGGGATPKVSAKADAVARSSSSANSGSEAVPVNTAMEQQLVPQLAGLIKQRFTTSKADALLHSATDIPKWLESMMVDANWRRLLIELFDTHRDSALLGNVCLPRISKLGHFRDLARVVRDTNHFDMFHGLVVHMVAEVVNVELRGGSAAAGAKEAVRTKGVQRERAEVVEDLCRMSRSSEHMLLYTSEFLSALESRLVRDGDAGVGVGGGTDTGADAGRLDLVRRLRQELGMDVSRDAGDSTGDKVEVWPVSSGRQLTASGNWSTPLSKKQLFAYKLTGAMQTLQTDASPALADVQEMLRSGKVYMVQVTRVYDALMGTSSSPGAAGPAVPAIVDAVVSEAKLASFERLARALQVPRFMFLLVHALVAASDATPQGEGLCSAVAMLLSAITCVTAADSAAAYLGASARAEAISADMRALGAALVQTSGLVRTLTKVTYGSIPDADARAAVALVRRDRVVALCVLHWCSLRLQHGTGHELVVLLDTRSTPLILELVVAAAEAHVALVPDCYEVIRDVLRIKATEGLSSEGVKMVVRDALDALVLLMGRGFVAEPMGLCVLLADSLDATLVRHMMQLLVVAVRTPFSRAFLSMFAELLERVLRRNSLNERFGAPNFDLLAGVYVAMDAEGLVEQQGLSVLLHSNRLLDEAVLRAKRAIPVPDDDDDDDDDGARDGSESPLF